MKIRFLGSDWDMEVPLHFLYWLAWIGVVLAFVSGMDDLIRDGSFFMLVVAFVLAMALLAKFKQMMGFK